jgi:hypothetical protein
MANGELEYCGICHQRVYDWRRHIKSEEHQKKALAKLEKTLERD